jgi:hypothetical protein
MVMGYDVGVCGMYGILLSADNIGPLHAELVAKSNDYESLIDDETYDSEEEVKRRKIAPEFQDRVIAALKERGVKVPAGAYLDWSGSNDDRPGRAATDPDEWIIGLGMLTRPWQWPAIPRAFRKLAEFHTWCWGG